MASNMGGGDGDPGESLDYRLCFLCQLNSGEALSDLSTSQWKAKMENQYKVMVQFISKLLRYDALPVDPKTGRTSIKLLNMYSCECMKGDGLTEEHCCDRCLTGDGSRISIADLVANKAKYHQSCRGRINKQKVEREEKKARAKRKAENQAEQHSPMKTRRQSEPLPKKFEPVCFFCDGEENEEGDDDLRQAMTLSLSTNVFMAAEKLRDTKSLRKLADGDIVAIEGVYHLRCLTKFYRRASKLEKHSPADKTRETKARVLSELAEYVEEFRGSLESLQMKDLVLLYNKRMSSLGEEDSPAHTTRLRIDLTKLIPDLKAVKINGKWELMFDELLGAAVRDFKKRTDHDKNLLDKTASLLRQNRFKKKRKLFDGSFSSTSEEESCDDDLCYLLYRYLAGPRIDAENDKPKESLMAVVKTAAQFLDFNIAKKRSKNPDAVIRHNRDKETPFSISLAMRVHLLSGSEALKDELACRGLAISNDRLRQICTDMANSIIKYWNTLGFVIPFQAVQNVFTVGGADNINYIPSSTTSDSKTVMNATSLSITQFFPADHEFIRPAMMNPEAMGKRSVNKLPRSYTQIEDIIFDKNADVKIPDLKTSLHPIPMRHISLDELLSEEFLWLEFVYHNYDKNLTKGQWISWAAFFSSRSSKPVFITKTHMFPLINEYSNNPATLVHVMKKVAEATEFLNPGQDPILDVDQPLFTICKKFQFTQDVGSGLSEQEFLSMIGPLHSEQVLWGLSGEWLENSGWTELITNAGITTEGTAKGILKVTYSTLLSSKTFVIDFGGQYLALKWHKALLKVCKNNRIFLNISGTSSVQNQVPSSGVSFWDIHSAQESVL